MPRRPAMSGRRNRLLLALLAALPHPGGGQSSTQPGGSGNITAPIVSCATCPMFKYIAGCTPGVGGTPGSCENCTVCPPGNFTAGCGLPSSAGGTCLPCPGWGGPGDSSPKTFSLGGSTGTPVPSCSACTVCGGVNGDGNAYEVAPCTATADATCGACAPCPQSDSTRFGCSQQSTGLCEPASDPLQVISTAAVGVTGVWETNARLRIDGNVLLPLPGVFAGTLLSMRAYTAIDFPPNTGPLLTLSAVQATPRMNVGLAPNVSTVTPIQLTVLSGAIIYLTPTGTSLSPLASITLVYDTSLYAAVLALSPASRLGVFTWNDGKGAWSELPGVTSVTVKGSQVTCSSQSFGPVAVMAVTPVASNWTDDAGGVVKPVRTDTSLWVPVLIVVAIVTTGVLGAIYIFHKVKARAKQRALIEETRKAASELLAASVQDHSLIDCNGSRAERCPENTPLFNTRGNNTPFGGAAFGGSSPMMNRKTSFALSSGALSPLLKGAKSLPGSRLQSLRSEAQQTLRIQRQISIQSSGVSSSAEYPTCQLSNTAVVSPCFSPSGNHFFCSQTVSGGSIEEGLEDCESRSGGSGRRRAIDELLEFRDILIKAGIGASGYDPEPDPPKNSSIETTGSSKNLTTSDLVLDVDVEMPPLTLTGAAQLPSVNHLGVSESGDKSMGIIFAWDCKKKFIPGEIVFDRAVL